MGNFTEDTTQKLEIKVTQEISQWRVNRNDEQHKQRKFLQKKKQENRRTM